MTYHKWVKGYENSFEICIHHSFIARGDHDFIIVIGTHKKWAHGKLKVSDKAKDYYRVGVLKSDLNKTVLKKIYSTCGCF